MYDEQGCKKLQISYEKELISAPVSTPVNDATVKNPESRPVCKKRAVNPFLR
jgi:hypothetical protein